MNQTPEQIARDLIDAKLLEAGWVIQSKKDKNLSASKGVAVREVQTSAGYADYILFVNRKPVGVIEAKAEKEGVQLVNKVENQSQAYAASKLKHLDNEPLPYVFESTGDITRFTNYNDPKPRSRRVFGFHQPETYELWLREDATLRKRVMDMPPLIKEGLRPAQIVAINNLEDSFQKNRPKALIQMATGAGKTFTACTFVYRLLKHAKAKRILFLVDTKNLGEQAENEFQVFQPKDDNLKFNELYNVQRLKSNFIASDTNVCISTIQRLYSILKDKELDEVAEEETQFDKDWRPNEPMPVVYNERYPFEFFDYIIVDECHRSIYNLWSQVLEYFDSFLIGLTATPDKRTLGYFDENLVSEYPYEESVLDGVNVPFDEYVIETKIGTKGSAVEAKQNVKYREKLSRKERWEMNEEEIIYSAKDLDRDVVAKGQIRKVIQEFKRATEEEIFPNRRDPKTKEYEMPKSLIFAKTDSHANDIIQMVREVFGEGNDFCRKITDGARKDKEDPKVTLNKFRNSWNPRIAVTVDMIATGTDVKPLEIVLFMRNVKSANYFEQMKGRGCRTISLDDLRQVTRTARYKKSHFVIVDAVGVLKNKKTTSRPLSTNKTIPLKSLLEAVTNGKEDEELFTTLADRLIRLEKQISVDDKELIKEKAQDISIMELTKNLIRAYDPDVIQKRADVLYKEENFANMELAITAAQSELILKAAKPFTGELSHLIENIRRVHEQLIDLTPDVPTYSGWVGISKDKAKEDIRLFTEYIEKHKDEISAINIFYQQPYKRRGLTQKIVKELLQHIKKNHPNLAPLNIWKAYEQLEEVKGKDPISELTALVALVRKVTKVDEVLTTFSTTVDKNFQDWIFKQNAGKHNRFTEEQTNWLRMIKSHITNSFDMQLDDLEYAPFDAQGGNLKMKQLFGDEMETIINELNLTLVA